MRAARHEGETANGPFQPDICADRRAFEGDSPEPVFRAILRLCSIVEGLVAHSFGQDPVAIDIGDAKLRIEAEPLAIGQQIAHFVDHALTIPCKIGRAFPVTAGGIGIGGNRPARLRAGKHMAFVRFADRDVGCRQVRQNGRPGQCAQCRWGVRAPVILADFDEQAKTGQVRSAENKVGPKRYAGPCNGDFLPLDTAPMGKPAFLVIFAVIGQEALGHRAQQPAAGHNQRAIVNLAPAAQRRTDQQDRRQRGRFGHDPPHGLLNRVQQRALQVQVVNRVTGHAQFGIDDQIHGRLVRAPCLGQDRFGVESHIRRSHLRGAGRDADETVRMRTEEGVCIAFAVRWGVHG